MHTGFLHARGKGATISLLSHINHEQDLSVAEIGYGTGATLVRLASEKNRLKISGVEISPVMFKTASARIKFCGLKNKIDLRLMEENLRLPFASETMDLIFAESVLGILENDALSTMTAEIYRVLKPGGRLILNETIWINSTSLQKIQEMNQFSKQAYGIIQASESCPYLADWKDLFNKHHFRLLKAEPIQSTPQKLKINKYLFLSNCFSIIGKIRSVFTKAIRRDKKYYGRKMRELKQEEKLMEGYLLIAVK